MMSFIFVSATLAYNPSYSDDPVPEQEPFFAGGTYDPTIPKPDDYLSYPIGDQPVRYHELVPYLEKLAAKSERVVMKQHGVTHEGRALYNLFISTAENIADLDSICTEMDRLAEPRKMIPSVEFERMCNDLPAFAWLGYSIHGDELSGVDAAVQLAYQLAAGTDPLTMKILENVIVIIDPIQNPDGRDRYQSMLLTNKSNVPNYDRGAMQHGGSLAIRSDQSLLLRHES